jgi:hypothetical protein
MYNKLSHQFAVKPFDEVMEQCNQTIKKYYSCFPFLLSMIQLLLNHSTLAKTEDMKKEILQQCILLSQRVKEESESSCDFKNANTMEALAEMALGNSEEVILLLNDKFVQYSGDDVMLIMAYQMRGDNDEANKVNQILLYQNVIDTLTLLNSYLALHMTEPVLFEQIYSQAKQLIDSFQMKEILTNAVFGIHIVAAQGYLMQQEKEKALNALEQYVNTVCGYQYPLRLKGNGYFTQVDTWLEDNITIGTSSPLDEITVKTNFIKMVDENPVFAPLREDEHYKKIIKNLKEKLNYKNA